MAGSDQSSPLETHQYPSAGAHTHTHTHAPLPPNSGGTVGSESEGEIESGRESAEREMDRTTEWKLFSFLGKLQ